MRDNNILSTTAGLAEHNSKEHLRAEQVYVRRLAGETHPIMLNAMVGYGSIGRMKLTKRQALELAHLLIDAVMAP